MSIGLVPGSFKPYHRGHDELVRLASEENDEVLLFVSLTDRVKKGEFPIYGAAMRRVWDEYLKDAIETSYPNVTVKYVETGTPVSMVYDELGRADQRKDEVKYQIYSDATDIKKYSTTALKKYAPYLFSKRRIGLRGIGRGETVDISGTAMRELLAAGNAREFARLLPASVSKHAQEIIDILTKNSAIHEDTLRSYIRLLIGL